MNAGFTRETALAALQQYNTEPFHLPHALTVEKAMRWYAVDLGHGEDADFWGLGGLLHDIDFEMWPDEHCKKWVELLEAINATPEFIHAVCSHAYGPCSDVEPVHEMENVIFAADELPGSF